MKENVIPQFVALEGEIVFSTSRSSGPGGQNVNKVNTKVTLKFNVSESNLLTVDQKNVIIHKLGAKLTKEGTLVIMSQDKRSQLQNKEDVIAKFNRLLTKVFTPRKVRKATKPTKSSKMVRMKNKKQHAEKKLWRQKL